MAVIEFINGSNKTYGAMKRVINYIINSVKTEPHLIDGFNCDINNAHSQFIQTKTHTPLNVLDYNVQLADFFYFFILQFFILYLRLLDQFIISITLILVILI